MKLTFRIGTAHPEEVIVYADQRNEMTQAIEKLFASAKTPLYGYGNETVIALDLSEVQCFSVENDRLFAHTQTQKLRLKQRLYQIEAALDGRFVKINQSCIINVEKIDHFDTSLSGTLSVILHNGYKDYVSRRNLKTVKERLGL